MTASGAMTLNEALTIAAIVVGPIGAVAVTRFIDKRREQYTRKLDVFRVLMRTRRTPTYPDHVGALNLIEIEFSRDSNVINAWKDLFGHFGTEHVRKDVESTLPSMDQSEIIRRNRLFWNRLASERQIRLAKVLHAMAKNLGFQAEQLEIFEGGYTPQGWSDVELEHSAIRRFFVDLYMGNRVLPVGVVNYIDKNSIVENNQDPQQ